MHVNFLEECLICLEISSPSMEAKNAHEHILVVGEVRHSLDILYMGVLTKPYVLGLYWYVLRMNEYIQEYYLWSLTRCVI